jgi:hypothetical protein
MRVSAIGERRQPAVAVGAGIDGWGVAPENARVAIQFECQLQTRSSIHQTAGFHGITSAPTAAACSRSGSRAR